MALQLKIKGFFIMGGVLCDVDPFTTYSIKNVVHRPYFATMNQYYHKQNFIDLSILLKSINIPFFVLPNHAILNDPNLIDFIKEFFEGNKTLLDICETYYNLFGGAKKPFDFMISRTIVNFITNELIVPSHPQSFMYVENEYGGTFLTDRNNLTFDDLKQFKILTFFNEEINLIQEIDACLFYFPCHILSIKGLENINSKKTEMSYNEHHTPEILDYRATLIKYDISIRTGGFKRKIIKRIRKY